MLPALTGSRDSTEPRVVELLFILELIREWHRFNAEVRLLACALRCGPAIAFSLHPWRYYTHMLYTSPGVLKR